MNPETSNGQLTLNVIPARGSGWSEIAAFAATFKAYSYWKEQWDHSDWSRVIPMSEYKEMVRRQGQPAERVRQVAKSVRQSYDQTGKWDGTLTEFRTYLFATWRGYHHMMIEPEDLTEIYDLLDAIRAKVASSELK